MPSIGCDRESHPARDSLLRTCSRISRSNFRRHQLFQLRGYHYYQGPGVRAFPSLVQVLFVSTLADLRRSRQRSRESHHAKQLPSLVNRSNGTPLFIGVQSCRYGLFANSVFLFANNLRLDKGAGFSVKVEVKPERRFNRTRQRTVWCHSEECATQTKAISKYGLNSWRWPITLGESRTMERQAARHEKLPKDIESKASQSALNRAPGVPHDDPFFVTQKGRPRKEHALSNAESRRGLIVPASLDEFIRKAGNP